MACTHEWIPPQSCPICKDEEIERLRAQIAAHEKVCLGEARTVNEQTAVKTDG